MIKFENVSYMIKNKTIINNLDFCINDGEMVAIVGKSGSGKSTVLNLCGGLIQATTGNVIVNDVVNPVYNDSKGRKLLHNDICFIFQNFVLLSEETVGFNFDLVKKFFPSEIKYEEILNKVGLDCEVLKQKVFELSGGEQQRVAIARNLLKPHNIILADEPTGSLDHQNRDIILSLLKNMNKEGKTVVVVTHDEVVTNKCDRRIEL